MTIWDGNLSDEDKKILKKAKFSPILGGFIIKNCLLHVNNKVKCFMYKFEDSGLSIKQLEKWFEGKAIDMYEFTGKFPSKIRKCPWCGGLYDNAKKHIKSHGKKGYDLMSIKIADSLYSLLLNGYLRNGHYEALSFMAHRRCSYCISPEVEGRHGKCALPESARNKPRSLAVLGFECDEFDIDDFNDMTVAIIRNS